MVVFRVLAAAFLIAGMGLASCASRRFDARRAFLDRARPATAEVTEVVQVRVRARRGTSTAYRYRLRWVAAGGRVLEAATQETDSVPEQRKGDRLPVVYDPDDPERVAIDSFPHLWFGVGLPAILGAGFLVEGALLLWIAAAPAPRLRTEATVPELWRAFKEGRLRRDSEFKGLLLALSFVSVALAVVATLGLLFAGPGLKTLLALLLLYAVFVSWRGIRRGRRLRGSGAR